jgi:hypothetical protein
MVQRAELIASAKASSSFVPLKPPLNTANLDPGHSNINIQMNRGVDPQAPRFNYEQYMKSLTEKI